MREMRKEWHQEFLERDLRPSHRGVDLVARWLEARGHRIRKGKRTEAATQAERHQHRDGGDLYMDNDLRMEVKHLTYAFTGREDWPFREKKDRQFMVCETHQWDLAEPKPHAFIYLNPPATVVAVVMGATRSSWWVLPCGDKRRPGYMADKYYCALETAKFLSFAVEEEEEFEL